MPGTHSSLEHDILAYLTNHPAAQDTVEGIVQWWILDKRIQDSIVEVQRALDRLVSRQLLIETKRVGAGSVYSINPEKSKTSNNSIDLS